MPQQSEASRPIFHLTRIDGTPVFLHPFIKRGSALEVPGSLELAGQYGEEPRVESLTILRNELYRRIDEDVRDWINERRFIPRFLISSAAFLVVFLFLSLVVHTPIPLVDELLGAGAAGVVTYLFLGRRFDNSRTAANRRVALRGRVDSAVFTEDPWVRSLEEILRRLERRDDLFAPPDATEAASELWKADRGRTSQVVQYLRQLMTTKPYRQLMRDLRRGSLSSSTRSRIDSGEVVPALGILLRELTASAE